MDSRKGDMSRVGGGFPGKDAGSEDGGREMTDFSRNIEHGKLSDHQDSFACRIRVSCTGLVNDQLRDVDLECAPFLFPPFLGDLLVAGYDQIPAGPGGQIARYGRLQVQSFLHGI